jgi:hypothetical protein
MTGVTDQAGSPHGQRKDDRHRNASGIDHRLVYRITEASCRSSHHARKAEEVDKQGLRTTSQE